MPFELITPLPWPRGLSFAGDSLYALCRGRPRGAGGPDPNIEDNAGAIFKIPTSGGAPELAYSPTSPPFKLWNRQLPRQVDIDTDRPYAGMVWHKASQNFFICCFSGIDKPTDSKSFQKNATDAVLRLNQSTSEWFEVERHDATVVPLNIRKQVPPNIDNRYFPSSPLSPPHRWDLPHGWLNGPDGLLVYGNALYVVGKDNHSLVRYDLSVLSGEPSLEHLPSTLLRKDSKEVLIAGRATELFDGPSSLATDGENLYIGMRSTDVVLGFPVNGPFKEGFIVAELPEGSEVIDIALSSFGNLFISTKKGKIWNCGKPNKDKPFTARTPKSASPVPPDSIPEFPPGSTPQIPPDSIPKNPVLFTSISVGRTAQLPGNGSNIVFDSEGTLYACCNANDGGIYRFVGADNKQQMTL